MSRQADAQTVRGFAEQVHTLRVSGLFGGDNKDAAEAVGGHNYSRPAAEQHYLIGLSLLEQAERHIKLAALELERENG
jgi:hypothetical protein